MLEGLSRWPFAIMLVAGAVSAQRAQAQDACHDDALLWVSGAPEDQATVAALRLLMGIETSGAPRGDHAWRLLVAGARVTARHAPSGDVYARTLDPSSTPYARALAGSELLVAARAASCGRSGPEQAGAGEAGAGEAAVEESPEGALANAGPRPAPFSFAVGLGARFDADLAGPWLLRPAALIELGLLRDGGPVHLSVVLEGGALGVYTRGDDMTVVRYERHDVTLGVGVGFTLGALVIGVRLLAGVSVRDVSAFDQTTPVGARLDAGAIAGGAASVRIRLVGPLGARLSVDLLGVPNVSTYLARGEPTVIEQPVRFGTAVMLDLELW